MKGVRPDLLTVVLVLFAVLLWNACADPVTDTGQVAQYHLDGNTKDSSGHGYDGVSSRGLVFVKGYSGQALSFDGSGDGADLGTITGIENDIPGLTITAWIRPRNLTGRQALVSRWGETSSDQQFTLYLDGPYLAIKVGDGMTGEEGMTDTSSRLQTGRYYFVTGTWSRDRTYTLCVWPGEFVTGNQTGDGIVDSTSAHLVLGGLDYPGPDQSFTGEIDEVTIYNRQLNKSELFDEWVRFGAPAVSPAPIQPVILLTKTIRPVSVSAGESAIVTVTAEAGAGPAEQVRVSDPVPADLIVTNGSTSRYFETLGYGKTASFSYSVTAGSPGTYPLDPAVVTYSDREGNQFAGRSNTVNLTVAAGPAPVRTTTQSAGFPGHTMILAVSCALGSIVLNHHRKPGSNRNP